MDLPQAVLISFASDGDAFVVGLADGTLYGGAVGGDEPLRAYRGLNGPALSADASPEAGQLAATADDGRVLIWEWPGGRLRTVIPHELRVRQCGVIAPGRYVTADEHRAARVFRWEPPATRESSVVSINGSENDVDEFAVSRARDEIVFRRNLDWAVWSLEEGRVREVFRRLDGSRLEYMDGEFALSRNGEFFLVYWDGAQLYRAADGGLVTEFPRDLNPSVVKVSDDGKRFAFGTLDGKVIVRDSDGQELVNTPQGDAPLLQMDFSPDGSHVSFVAEGSRYGIVETDTRKLVLTPESLARRITDL